MTPSTLYLAPIITFLTRATYATLIQNQAQKLGISLDADILEALLNQSPILAGASGGKDSACMIILLHKFLNSIQYRGEKVICHADLGEIEHIESIDEVRRLADFVGWKLKIVRRERGGLLERYTQRWQDNCRRWANLECVNLISPWPQASSPFCRSETKVAPITQAAVKLFPKTLILNVIGLRAEESAKRARNPISKPNDKLSRADGTSGRDWFPILHTPIETVWLTHRNANFPRHPQYDRGNERISCAYCFLASKNDWEKGAAVSTNHNSYRHISKLEILSTFSYRQHDWLSDIQPQILSSELRAQLDTSKAKASNRKLIEARIPTQLLFANSGGRQGWPSFQPTIEQCEIVAAVRRDIGTLMGPEIQRSANTEILYTTAQAVYERYAQLLSQRQTQLLHQTRRLRTAPRTTQRLPSPLTTQSAQPALFLT
jgi:3'-phosphoadenosine 5'-phosphosulfate sulfotransferase (PAPS reductase)/FAD synthetase